MDYPIMSHLDAFVKINNILPADRFISKEEIELLSENDIAVLRTYFFYTMPTPTINDDYLCLRRLIELTAKVLYTIKDGAIVIAPGDSPFKPLNLIEMFYRVDENTYEYIDRTDKYGNEFDVRKYIKFITFPISGLNSETDPFLLDNYLNDILIANGVNIHEIYQLTYLDHIHAGNARRALENSLKRITRNQKFILNIIDLSDLMINILPSGSRNYCYSNYTDVMAETEIIGARCIPKYKLGKSMVYPNLLRCNMINLLAIDKINSDLELSTIDADNLWDQIEGKLIKISYYDNNLLNFTQKSNKFRFSPNGYLYDGIGYIQINSITNIEIIQDLSDD